MARRNAKKEEALSHRALCAALHYDPDTGIFTRIDGYAVRCAAKAGSVLPTGYRIIRALKGKFLAHRLAWFYVHGEWPEEIDHINRNKDDNRICNLRPVSRAQNCANTDGWCNSDTGIKNIRRNRKNYQVHVYRNGKPVVNKVFSCLCHAIKVRNELISSLNVGGQIG